MKSNKVLQILFSFELCFILFVSKSISPSKHVPNTLTHTYTQKKKIPISVTIINSVD